MTDPTMTWEDDGGPCAPDGGVMVTVSATPAQIAAFWEACADVAPGQKSCGTCQHWNERYGVCGVITHGGPPYDVGAEIEGGGQGVSEDVSLVTDSTFFCALWRPIDA